MTLTARVFDHNDIGIAWSFALECEDENPRGYGVDHLPAYPTRRDGVFRQRSHADATVPWFDEAARADEEAMLARLDGELGEDDEANDVEEPRRFEDDEVEVCDDDAMVCEPAAPVDPIEMIPSREGIGRRPRVAVVVALRRG